MKFWEPVLDEDGDLVEKMRIPEGQLYRTTTRRVRKAKNGREVATTHVDVTFVPRRK